jgi:hypothetical protein
MTLGTRCSEIETAAMNRAVLDEVLEQQAGVVSRRQLLAIGARDSDIARMLRRRELARVHQGVFVDHTGPLNSEQVAWAAVLYYWPAALTHRSAIADVGDPGSLGREIHVAVDSARRVDRLAGVTVHRLKDFGSVALMNLSPPRVRVEHAALEAAAAAVTARQAVGVLADVCQARRTTPARLLSRLDAMPRLRRRRLLREILADVAAGAFSVLERMYLREVERPHGFPSGRRQRRVRLGRSAAYRDVEYVEQRLVVELDGRLGHERSADRWADLDRDVEAAADRRLTVRLGYGQVLEPCRVAAALARVLHARGWTGRPVPCGAGCSVSGVDGGFHAPDERHPPLIA